MVDPDPVSTSLRDELLETLQVGVIAGSPSRGVFVCNQKAAELLGVPRDQLLGRKATEPGWDFVREDGSPMPPEEYPANVIYRTGRPVQGLVFGIRRPASERPAWVLVNALPRFDADGRVDHVVVTYEDISRRKEAESALRESEGRYRTLFEGSPDGILVADPDRGTFSFANDAICRYLGYGRDELTGLAVGDIHPPADVEWVTGLFRAQAAGELDLARDVPCLRKDGTVVRADVHARRLEIAGKPYLAGIFRDKSERLRAEQAVRENEVLAESRERYRSLVEDQAEVICRFRADGTITFVNDVFCRFFGKPRAELVGAKWQPVPVPEDVPRIEEILGRQTPQNPVVLIENRVRSAGGEVRWMQFLNRAFFDPDGTKVEIQAIGRDITERKQVEEELSRHRDHLEELVRQRTLELAQSEERYRRVVESSPEAILVHAEGRVVYANPAAAVVFRAGRVERLIGRRILDLVTPEFQEIVHRRISTTYEQKTLAERLQEKVVGLDGTVIDADVETVPIIYGGRECALSLVRDITAERRLEAEIRNSQKLESVGLLAGGIAHDFNNLLSAILGNIALARLQPPGSPDVEERLIQAERAVDRAIALTRQLLTFSRGGAPIRRVVDLASVLTETAEFALRGSNVACAWDIEPGLWAADADVGQVSQVIHNIVINAQQAMPDGGTLRIRAVNEVVEDGRDRHLEPGRYVRVSLRDTGIGVLPEHLDRIFDPYFTTKAKGSGLGLAVCHSIVRQHGGALRAESVVGVGSTFHVWLPAAAEAPARPAEVRPRAEVSGGGRILVMDDDPDLLYILSKLLESLGYLADTVSDGTQAVERYAEAMNRGRPYDAVILDLTVPGGMGGREAVGRLLELDPDAAVIVSSGYSNDPVMANPEPYGFKGVLAKPFHVDAVSEVLGKVVAARRVAGA